MTEATRETFNKVILVEDADSFVFLYTTENVNYAQRKIAFQANLVAETLQNHENVGDKVKFYSYDVAQHGFPKGIPNLTIPVQDREGNKAHEPSGLPTSYFLPAGQKSLPFTRYAKDPYAQDIISFIKEMSTQYLQLDLDDFKSLGYRGIDEQAFHRRIDKEGVIQLSAAFDEL